MIFSNKRKIQLDLPTYGYAYAYATQVQVIMFYSIAQAYASPPTAATTYFLQNMTLSVSRTFSTTTKYSDQFVFIFPCRYNLTRFNKIATQGAPQMAVDKEANSLSRVYSILF